MSQLRAKIEEMEPNQTSEETDVRTGKIYCSGGRPGQRLRTERREEKETLAREMMEEWNVMLHSEGKIGRDGNIQPYLENGIVYMQDLPRVQKMKSCLNGRIYLARNNNILYAHESLLNAEDRSHLDHCQSLENEIMYIRPVQLIFQ